MPRVTAAVQKNKTNPNTSVTKSTGQKTSNNKAYAKTISQQKPKKTKKKKSLKQMKIAPKKALQSNKKQMKKKGGFGTKKGLNSGSGRSSGFLHNKSEDSGKYHAIKPPQTGKTNSEQTSLLDFHSAAVAEWANTSSEEESSTTMTYHGNSLDTQVSMKLSNKQSKHSAPPQDNLADKNNIIELAQINPMDSEQTSLIQRNSSASVQASESHSDVKQMELFPTVDSHNAPKTPGAQLLEDLNAAGLNFDSEDQAMEWVENLDHVLQEEIAAGIKTRWNRDKQSLEMTGKMKSKMNSYTSQDPLTKDRSDFSRYTNNVDNAIWTLAVLDGGVENDARAEEPSIWEKGWHKFSKLWKEKNENEDKRFLSRKQVKTSLTRNVSNALKKYNNSIKSNPNAAKEERLGPAVRDLANNYGTYSAAQVHPGKHHIMMFKKAVAEYERGSDDFGQFVKSITDILGRTDNYVLAGAVGSGLEDLISYGIEEKELLASIQGESALSAEFGTMVKAYFPNSLVTEYGILMGMKKGRARMKQILKAEKMKVNDIQNMPEDEKPLAGTHERAEFENALTLQRIRTDNLDRVLKADPLLLQRMVVTRQLVKSITGGLADQLSPGASDAINIATSSYMAALLSRLCDDFSLQQGRIQKALSSTAKEVNADIQEDLITDDGSGKLISPASRSGKDAFRSKAIKGALDPITRKRPRVVRILTALLLRPPVKLLKFVFPRTAHNIKSMSPKDFFTSRQGPRALWDAAKDIAGTPFRGITVGFFALRHIAWPVLEQALLRPATNLLKDLYDNENTNTRTVKGKAWAVAKGIAKTTGKVLLGAVSLVIAPAFILISLAIRVGRNVSEAYRKSKAGGGVLRPKMAAENPIKQFQAAIRNDFDLRRKRNYNTSYRSAGVALNFGGFQGTLLAHTAANGVIGNIAYFGVLGSSMLYDFISRSLGEIRTDNKNEMQNSLASQTYRLNSLHQKAHNLENEIDQMTPEDAETYIELRCNQLNEEATQLTQKHEVGQLIGNNKDVERLREIEMLLSFSNNINSNPGIQELDLNEKNNYLKDLAGILKYEEFAHTSQNQISRLMDERKAHGKANDGNLSETFFNHLKQDIDDHYRNLRESMRNNLEIANDSEDDSVSLPPRILTQFKNQLSATFQKEGFEQRFKTSLKTVHQLYASIDSKTAARELVETYQSYLNKNSGAFGDMGRMEEYFKEGLGCDENDMTFIQSALQGELQEFSDAAFDDKGRLKENHDAERYNTIPLSRESGVELVADFILAKVVGGSSDSLKKTIKNLISKAKSQYSNLRNADESMDSLNDIVTATESNQNNGRSFNSSRRQTQTNNDKQPGIIEEEEQSAAVDLARAMSNSEAKQADQSQIIQNFNDKIDTSNNVKEQLHPKKKNQNIKPQKPSKLSENAAGKLLRGMQDQVMKRYLDLFNNDLRPVQKSIFTSLRKNGYLNFNACNNLLRVGDKRFQDRMFMMEIADNQQHVDKFRKTQTAVKKYLKTQNLKKESSHRDGNCLYASIGAQVGNKDQQQVREDLADLYLNLCTQEDDFQVTLSNGQEISVADIKERAAKYHFSFSTDNADQKTKVYWDISDNREWGDNEQAFLAEIFYQRPVCIIRPSWNGDTVFKQSHFTPEAQQSQQNSDQGPIYLVYDGVNHYDYASKTK